MIKTYKYRLKDRIARKALLDHARAVNQVWNYCNAVQRDLESRYRAGAPKRKWPSNYDLQYQTAGTSKDLGINAQTVAEICRQFASSRDKAKHSLKFRSSFGLKRARGWVPFQRQSRRVDGNAVTYLGRTYRFFGSKHRPLPDDAKGGCFTEDARGRWWVCFHVEVANDNGAATCEIGIDLGLKALATTSDGEVIDNPRHIRRYAERLAIAQRSGNRQRARAIHAKIANCRRDQHHKISTRLAREYAFIAVGNVNAKALKKTRMAKSVSDAGWSAFRSMLAYKAASYVEVDERFTTQTCSTCGTLPTSRPKGIAGLGIRSWVCSDCGETHDRDVNAARNILRIARSVPRPVEESRRVAA